MKITLTFPLLVAALLVHTVSAITPELDEKAKAAREKCKDVSKINEALKQDCHAACWMKEMGYMTDGEINLKNMEEANKQKWDNQTLIDLGIFVDTACSKQVGNTKDKDECAVGYEFGTCKKLLVKKTGLKPPTPLKPKKTE